ncbi:hypothetical protein [Actinoallomurus sp. NPDC052274]|uniref:hypothetical protein n=1 Tax=Actinoallomurus sp. NPDC052274 TaxID=3155420 RepID=UPI00343188AD
MSSVDLVAQLAEEVREDLFESELLAEKLGVDLDHHDLPTALVQRLLTLADAVTTLTARAHALERKAAAHDPEGGQAYRLNLLAGGIRMAIAVIHADLRTAGEGR